MDCDHLWLRSGVYQRTCLPDTCPPRGAGMSSRRRGHSRSRTSATAEGSPPPITAVAGHRPPCARPLALAKNRRAGLRLHEDEGQRHPVQHHLQPPLLLGPLRCRGFPRRTVPASACSCASVSSVWSLMTSATCSTAPDAPNNGIKVIEMETRRPSVTWTCSKSRGSEPERRRLHGLARERPRHEAQQPLPLRSAICRRAGRCIGRRARELTFAKVPLVRQQAANRPPDSTCNRNGAYANIACRGRARHRASLRAGPAISVQALHPRRSMSIAISRAYASRSRNPVPGPASQHRTQKGRPSMTAPTFKDPLSRPGGGLRAVPSGLTEKKKRVAVAQAPTKSLAVDVGTGGTGKRRSRWRAISTA